jgi:hypothetical protein
MNKQTKLLIGTICVTVIVLMFAAGIFRYNESKTAEGSGNPTILFSGEVNSTSPIKLQDIKLNGSGVATFSLRYAYSTESPDLSIMQENSQYEGTGTSATVYLHSDSGNYQRINLGDLWQTTNIVSSIGYDRVCLLSGETCNIEVEVESAWSEGYYERGGGFSNFMINSGWGTHGLQGVAYIEIKLFPLSALSTVTKTTYNISPLPLELEQIDSQYVVINMTGWTNKIGDGWTSSIYHLPVFQTGTVTLGYVK